MCLFQTGVHTRPAIQEERHSETTKIVRTTSSGSSTKDSRSEGSGLGPLALLRTKTKGDPNLDAKTLSTVKSCRSLEKGEFDMCVQLALLNITWGIE